MAVGLYLADTNILIRLMKRNHPEYQQVRHAVSALKASGIELCYTLQNMAEFWNASTRPLARNGFGLTVDETNADAQDIERGFTLLADTSAVYREWRRIVVEQQVSGVQVHDARLAASMYAHQVTHILTFNVADFRRYPGLTPIHPRDVPSA